MEKISLQKMDSDSTPDSGVKPGLNGELSFNFEASSKDRALIYEGPKDYRTLFWEHKHTTITLCFVFWSFGTCVAFLGPTLLDLGCKTGTVFSTMSFVFFSQSLFILLGSACAGFMLKRFSKELMLLVGTTMMALSMASIPLCNALWALAIVLAVMGFFMGTIDTVANVTMICMYGKDVSPFLQALHFFYGVGAFLSPMIAQPFLLNEDCSPFISNDTEPLFPEDENEVLPASTLEEARNMTEIDYAFIIMALTMVPVVLLAFSLLGKKHCLQWMGGGSKNKDEKLTKDYENAENHCGSDQSPRSLYQVVIVTVLSAILMFLYDGLQAAYGGFIYSYAVKGPIKVHKSHAAYLNALFWGMFALGRLFSIVLATKLSSSFMLFCNIMGCTAGLLLMLSLRYNYVVLVFGTCIIGVFMSSVFPTALSLTEQYIHVTPTTTSILVFGAAVGEMTMPVIIGHEFERAGPTSFLVIGMILCFISIIAYMTLWLVGLTLLKPDTTPGIMVFFAKVMPQTVQKMEGENTNLVNQNVQYYSRMNNSAPHSPDQSPEGVVSFVRKENEAAH
ncbi:major facilitator superfamily domain-containing protein 4A-like isoform X2 [Parasteatoda tepidariorum]|uniref:major facilitator superfamily domain-containing protein 4A-like isoform X2 n=1 Tax=Parasteatoda tepidariorum TaxID=114398 RepID=UPI001C723F15|nr:major facilitator superfamily domain-containing protein 4A-like isoform X2 [Parasteatoda tepidariorum]